MRENQPIQKKRIWERVTKIIRGGPLVIPESISTLDATYRPLPTIVFDSSERRKLDCALAGVDAATIISRENFNPDDDLARVYYATRDSALTLPSRQVVSSNRTQARFRALEILQELGVIKIFTISQPTEGSPTRLVPRKFYKINRDPKTVDSGDDLLVAREISVQEHVSKVCPPRPGTYSTERSTTRGVRFSTSKAQ